MTFTIQPKRIYPIGEFADGHRLCASVEAHRVEWFPEHRNFDLDLMYRRVNEIPDDAPTLRDEEFQGLIGHDDWFWN